jgi:sugar phosphate isomerase/epimerase
MIQKGMNMNRARRKFLEGAMATDMSQARREFLKTIGLCAAAGAGLSVFAAEMKWQMRLATSSIQFKQLTLEETCRQISELGFEAIDIWDKFDDCPHLDQAEKLGGAGLKELLARHNLKLSAFTVYGSSYERYAELLGNAGGGIAVRSSEYGSFKPEELSSRMKQFLEKLKPLIELAEKHNGYLAIENHGDALLNSPDSFKAFVDMNRSPRAGIALAPYHLQVIKASVPDVIRICGQQLFFFYAWQKADGFDQFPGHGPMDFRPCLQALADIRYERHVNPFMHGHPATEQMVAALAKSRDYLKQLTI